MDKLLEEIADLRFVEDDIQTFPDGVRYLSERGMNKVISKVMDYFKGLVGHEGGWIG
uniref:Uncharacterized protein n=1 Tax=viral metagenome TaxID=1070528 RepID=A0A6M3JM65_9ZZZZ